MHYKKQFKKRKENLEPTKKGHVNEKMVNNYRNERINIEPEGTKIMSQGFKIKTLEKNYGISRNIQT